MASAPAISAVASVRGSPATAASTATNRRGRAATAPTTNRIASIRSPAGRSADATFTSGKSHTSRSRTFSK